MAAGRSGEQSKEVTDNDIWGTYALPYVLMAIGGFDGKVYGITLHAEYGSYATATIKFGCGSEITRGLPHFGTNWLSAIVGAPKGLQAITLDVNEGEFVIAHCRYAPIDMSVIGLCNALLKASEDGN